MKYKIELQRPIVEESNFGDEIAEFVPTKTIYAERVKVSPSHHEEVAEMFPDYQVQFNIRDAHEVEEHWRVRQLGGYLYNVVNIVPNLDRGMKTLICERVNE